MDLNTMNSIKNMLQNNSNRRFNVEDRTGQEDWIRLIHTHVNDHPNHGIFNIKRREDSYSLFVVLTIYEPDDPAMYRMHVFSGDRKEALGEFHNIVGNDNLSLPKYVPRKRDGRNDERREIFEEAYGSLSVEIPVQADKFLDELFRYAENRSRADNLIEA